MVAEQPSPPSSSSSWSLLLPQSSAPVQSYESLLVDASTNISQHVNDVVEHKQPDIVAKTDENDLVENSTDIDITTTESTTAQYPESISNTSIF